MTSRLEELRAKYDEPEDPLRFVSVFDEWEPIAFNVTVDGNALIVGNPNTEILDPMPWRCTCEEPYGNCTVRYRTVADARADWGTPDDREPLAVFEPRSQYSQERLDYEIATID